MINGVYHTYTHANMLCQDRVGAHTARQQQSAVDVNERTNERINELFSFDLVVGS